jgi:hypothetical protein
MGEIYSLHRPLFLCWAIDSTKPSLQFRYAGSIVHFHRKSPAKVPNLKKKTLPEPSNYDMHYIAKRPCNKVIPPFTNQEGEDSKKKFSARGSSYHARVSLVQVTQCIREGGWMSRGDG